MTGADLMLRHAARLAEEHVDKILDILGIPDVWATKEEKLAHLLVFTLFRDAMVPDIGHRAEQVVRRCRLDAGSEDALAEDGLMFLHCWNGCRQAPLSLVLGRILMRTDEEFLEKYRLCGEVLRRDRGGDMGALRAVWQMPWPQVRHVEEFADAARAFPDVILDILGEPWDGEQSDLQRLSRLLVLAVCAPGSSLRDPVHSLRMRLAHLPVLPQGAGSSVAREDRTMSGVLRGMEQQAESDMIYWDGSSGLLSLSRVLRSIFYLAGTRELALRRSRCIGEDLVWLEHCLGALSGSAAFSVSDRISFLEDQVDSLKEQLREQEAPPEEFQMCTPPETEPEESPDGLSPADVIRLRMQRRHDFRGEPFSGLQSPDGSELESEAESGSGGVSEPESEAESGSGDGPEKAPGSETPAEQIAAAMGRIRGRLERAEADAGETAETAAAARRRRRNET